MTRDDDRGGFLSHVHPPNERRAMSTDTETVREAWFAIGGWVAAIALALWHWRHQIIDAVDRFLDRADDLAAMAEGVTDDDVAQHPAGYVYIGGHRLEIDVKIPPTGDHR